MFGDFFYVTFNSDNNTEKYLTVTGTLQVEVTGYKKQPILGYSRTGFKYPLRME